MSPVAPRNTSTSDSHSRTVGGGGCCVIAANPVYRAASLLAVFIGGGAGSGPRFHRGPELEL